MEQIFEITECYKKCPFFHISMDGMECTHPYWETRGVYENLIITMENSVLNIPPLCPLRDGELSTTYKLGDYGKN